MTDRSIVILCPSEYYSDAHKLMWALGKQPETGKTFTVVVASASDPAAYHGCHSSEGMIPDPLPDIDWGLYGLTGQRAAEVAAALTVSDEYSPDWGTERFEQVLAVNDVAQPWVQPLGAHDAPELGARRAHWSWIWIARIPYPAAEPGTFHSGWQPELQDGADPPAWYDLGPVGWIGPTTCEHGGVTYDLPQDIVDFREPGAVGAVWVARAGDIIAWAPGTNYLAGNEERSHGGEDWINIRANNTQQLAPGTVGSGWLRISNRPAPWYDVGTPYYPVTLKGSDMKATSGGNVWRNTSPNNNFAPGVFGWVSEGPAP